jgi:hypothetical protein
MTKSWLSQLEYNLPRDCYSMVRKGADGDDFCAWCPQSVPEWQGKLRCPALAMVDLDASKPISKRWLEV